MVLPAGLFYKFGKSRKSALIGSFSGLVLMTLLSLPINYFITYPIYAKIMPIEVIIGMYKSIFPEVDGLVSCLIIFNMPFTFVRGFIDSIITFLIYKRVSWIFKLKKN